MNEADLDRKQSLQVLDPSPEEESPVAPEKSSNSYFPAPAGSSALGLHTHNTAYYCESSSLYLCRHSRVQWPSMSSTDTNASTNQTVQLAQRYSSYTFTAFLAQHITSTSLLPLALGAQPASKYLLLFRPYYQSYPLAEPLLVLAPLAIHITSGIALRIHRRRILLRHYGYYDADAQGDPESWSLWGRDGKGDVSSGERVRASKGAPWPKLTWTARAGYMAIPLVAGHAALTRLLPLYVDGGSSSIGLDYISHGIALAPALGYLGFTALVGVVGSHVVWGWARWTGLAPGEAVEGEEAGVVLRRKRRFWGVWLVAAGVVGGWLAGGLGVVGRDGRAGGWVGGVYDQIYGRVPGLGRWV